MKPFRVYINKYILKVALVLFLSCTVWMVFATDTHSNRHYDALAVKVVKCYPNPATSFVNFDVDYTQINKGNSIQVFSFSGKKLFETQIKSLRTTLTFNESFFRGIYVYQLKDKSGKIIETGKFQVVK